MIKRYSQYYDDIDEDPIGEWVRYEDCAALSAALRDLWEYLPGEARTYTLAQDVFLSDHPEHRAIIKYALESPE